MLTPALGCALARRLLAAALLVAALPPAAHAQFGALKKLKNKVSPDSATKASTAMARATTARDSAAIKDSLAIAAKLAASDTAKGKQSRLSRIASKAASASAKLEDATGVSVKDVALAASGAGVGVIAAKKLGMDPTSLMSKASGQAGASHASMAGMTKVPSTSSRTSTAAVGKASRIGTTLPTSMPSMASMPSMPGGRAMPPNAPYSDADMKMMQAFQTEMMRVSMAASQGDASAEVRLQRLQEISAKYEPEMERLSLRGTVADTAAVRRLVNIQVEIMREWMKDAPVAVKAANTAKPTRVTKP